MDARIGSTLALCTVFAAAAPVAAQTVYPRGTTIWDPSAADNGYTVFIAQGEFAALIDMDGTLVHEWRNPTPGFSLSDVHPLPGGHILAFSFDPSVFPPPARTIVELDWDGNEVWSYTMPATWPPTTTFHHDVVRLPGGNTLVMGVQTITVPSISPLPIADDFLLEIDPAGNLVWAWQTFEHFDEFRFDGQAQQLIAAQGGDWAHSNAVSVLPPNRHGLPEFAEGNLLVSQRFTNTIFIIDKKTGKIVWKMGPEQDQVTHGQHLPYMIEPGLPGEGNILVFDNGSGTGYPLNGRAPAYSSVPEIDPVSKTVVWRYNASMSGELTFRFSSDIVSNAQRLPNGNTMICSGVQGRFFEVTPAGTIVWEYMTPYENPIIDDLVYRAYRVPYSWPPVPVQRGPARAIR